MRSSVSVLFLALVLSLGSIVPAGASEILEARHSVTLEDAAGDVESYDGKPVLDPTGLTIASDGTQLAFTVALASDAGAVLESSNSAGAVVTVFLDRDDDAATGVGTTFGGKSGFELELEIKACIEYEAGEACGGGLGGSAQKGYFAAWSVRKVVEGELQPAHNVFWSSPRGELAGKALTVSVPYSELGLRAGQEVRIAVQEEGGGFGPEAFLPEVRLTLK